MSDDEILSRASYYELLSLYINRNTPLAARLSCGGTIDAALAVTEGRFQRAIAIVRPPGHHAEPRDFMGFCFYNNVAVATKVVQARKKMRVLILDWWVTLRWSFCVYNLPTGTFIMVRQSFVVERWFSCWCWCCQGMGFTSHSRMTLLCFTFRFIGTKAEPSILEASLAGLDRAERARD